MGWFSKSPAKVKSAEVCWVEETSSRMQGWLEGSIKNRSLPPCSEIGRADHCRMEDCPQSELGVLILSDSAGSTLNFVFAASATLKATEFASRLGNSALVCRDWPRGRTELEPKLSVFVLSDRVTLGPGTGTSDHVSAWGKSFGVEFCCLKLQEPATLNSAQTERVPVQSLPMGSQTEFLDLVNSIDCFQASRPRIVALSRSWYNKNRPEILIRRATQEYGHRMIPISIKNLPKVTVSSVLRDMINQLKDAGLELENVQQGDNLLERSRGATNAKKVGCGLAGFAGMLGLIFFAPWVAILSPALVHTVSLGTVAVQDALDEQVSVPRLMDAIVSDLTSFVEHQRANYYLWRRPVFILGNTSPPTSVVEVWLRTVLLKDERFLALAPVLVIKGAIPDWPECSDWQRSTLAQPDSP